MTLRINEVVINKFSIRRLSQKSEVHDFSRRLPFLLVGLRAIKEASLELSRDLPYNYTYIL